MQIYDINISCIKRISNYLKTLINNQNKLVTVNIEHFEKINQFSSNLKRFLFRLIQVQNHNVEIRMYMKQRLTYEIVILNQTQCCSRKNTAHCSENQNRLYSTPKKRSASIVYFRCSYSAGQVPNVVSDKRSHLNVSSKKKKEAFSKILGLICCVASLRKRFRMKHYKTRDDSDVCAFGGKRFFIEMNDSDEARELAASEQGAGELCFARGRPVRDVYRKTRCVCANNAVFVGSYII